MRRFKIVVFFGGILLIGLSFGQPMPESKTHAIAKKCKCGVNAECQFNNLEQPCSCKTGFSGDPFIYCYPLGPNGQSSKYECPEKEKENYKIIDKKCYYFNIKQQKYEDAQKKCKEVFNNDTKGRIFEPRSIEHNNKVLEATKEFTGGKVFNYWLGMTDKQEEGKFKYQSDDKSVEENFGNGKDMPWFTAGRRKEPNGGKGAACVYAFAKNNKWFDFRCTRSTIYSICELPPTGTDDKKADDKKE